MTQHIILQSNFLFGYYKKKRIFVNRIKIKLKIKKFRRFQY
jgi:hypothetical protein